MDEIEPIRIVDGAVEVIDQTVLPFDERRVVVESVEGMAEAIEALRVRGAPLLGICGAAGMAIAAESRGTDDATLAAAARELKATRPTAVDLETAVDRALAYAGVTPEGERVEALWRFTARMLAAQETVDRTIGDLGSWLPGVSGAVLTHCNTGALATGARGTALSVVRAAFGRGAINRCYATETRPLLQGARLTMWELQRLGIPATLLPDTAAAALIGSGRVSAVITGADRVARNGDSANKIGTYGLALAASRHRVPFYIAAPTTTIDCSMPHGGGIPIEERDPGEVGGYGEWRWSPEGGEAYNPAFDVTPSDLITAIVTEKGVVHPPLGRGIAEICAGLRVAALRLGI